MDKEYYLFVEGKKVVVSKEVYLAYHSELNKEKYQIRRDRFDLNPKIRNTDGGVFVCQNTQKNLKLN